MTTLEELLAQRESRPLRRAVPFGVRRVQRHSRWQCSCGRQLRGDGETLLHRHQMHTPVRVEMRRAGRTWEKCSG